MHEIMTNTPGGTCANARANICDTAKENRAMMADLRFSLDKLSSVLECCPVPPCNEAVSAEPNCLLDEVLLQKAMLEDMICTVKRMSVSLCG